MNKPTLVWPTRTIDRDDWQTRARGTNKDEYETYVYCLDDGKGNDVTTGQPLKTFDEWLNS